MERKYDILKNPVVTEKSMVMVEANQYVFDIDKTATKTEVKDAIEKIFKVNVLSVQVNNRKGKVKRFRGVLGKRNDKKRAIVRLKEGQKLDVLPN